MAHSYDKTRACPECGDLDGCHIPQKVRRHRPGINIRTEATEALGGQLFPRVVCLCGSTRFIDAFQKANYAETMQGNIVLSVGFYPHSAQQAHGEGVGCTDAAKAMLDDLHKRKIDHADEVFVLNVGGYIGSSTRGEIEYATRVGKKIRYLEPVGD